MEINQPNIVAELTELARRYEEALVTNDVPTLTAMFWDSAHVMRFGATENLYGSEQLEAFRRSRPSAGLAREILRLDVVTFGTDFGSVTLEFARETGGRRVLGRQSQTWVRLPGGWRIVAAHVSLLNPPA